MYQNVRGLNTKLSSLLVNSYGFTYDVIIFSETWLNDDIYNAEILSNKYQIYRYNRNARRGGGVLIAVSCLYQSEVIVTDSLNIEFVAVVVKLKNKKIYLTCSYVPPDSDCLIYSKHVQAIESIVLNMDTDDSIFVVGDFNLPSISWRRSSDTPYLIPVKNRNCHDDFLNDIFGLYLYQMNDICNDFGKLLDLVFVNDADDCTITRSMPITLPEDRYHPTIEISSSIPSEVKLNTSKLDKVFCFKRTNINSLNNLIKNTSWNDVLCTRNNSSSDIDIMITIFYEKIYSFFETCVPKKSVYTPSGPPWNSKQLARLKNLKNKNYKNYKKSGSLIDYGRYSVSRSEYILLNQALYLDYLNNVKNNFVSDPKSFYEFVKSKRKFNGYPSVMKFRNQESGNVDVICDMFADFFATTYSDDVYDDTKTYPYALSSNHGITFPKFNSNDILVNLKKLKKSFSHGPDGIPSFILNCCAESLVSPLTLLFNASIKCGYFPVFWRDSYIIPLFKSGNKSDITNYRGIAKLSAIPKLFEKLVADFLCHHTSSLLAACQHGFRKGCSTTTNVLHFTNLINLAFTQRKQTDAVYTDFSKAFDKVNHKLLLTKLDLLGVTHRSLSWLKSYLMGRKQTIRFNNSISKYIYVSSGVPQGSHLGPILFSLFINDLPNVIKSANILMYADDVKIFHSFNCFADHVYLQSDLNNFFLWCNHNMMELNLKKCKCMRFFRTNCIAVNYSLGGHHLELVDFFLDLGVLLDPKLNFVSHITLTVNKARGVLAFIKRWAKEFSDPYITKQLYVSLVRPILEYGSIIWDPHYNIHNSRIESVQKQFMLFCLRDLQWSNSRNLPSYTSRLALIKLPTLKSRRTMLNVSFMMNLINGDICCEFLINSVKFNIPSRNTRHYNLLFVKFCSANYAIADPFTRLCRQFNYLSQFVDFSLNSSVIKHKIILFLNS